MTSGDRKLVPGEVVLTGRTVADEGKSDDVILEVEKIEKRS